MLKTIENDKKIYQDTSITKVIKAQRIQWIEHVMKMGEQNTEAYYTA